MNSLFLNKTYKTALTLCLFFSALIPAYSLTNDQKDIKNNAYRTIAEALFAESTYDKYRIEIIETIGKLAVPNDDGYNTDVYRTNLIDNTLKKMLAAVEKKKHNKDQSATKNTENNLKEKLKRIKNKDDASIAYMLAEALEDEDISIQLYAAASLIKVREKAATPLFIDLLDSKKTQHKIIGLTVLPYLESEKDIPQIVNIIKDKEVKTKIRLIAFNALKKVNETNAKEVANTLMNGDNEILKTEAILYLASKDDSSAFDLYKKILQSDKTRKTALEGLPFLALNLQEKSFDLLNSLYKEDDNFTKMMVISAISKLNNQESFIEKLKESLNNENIHIKLITINTIANSQNPKIIQLIDDLGFDQPQLDTKAVTLLLTANNDLLTPLLIKLMDKDNDFLKLGISSYFLSKKQNTELAKETLESLFENKNEIIKYRAAFILNREDNVKANEIIHSLLKSEDATYKAKAIIALAEKGDKAVIPYLSNAIENNDQNPQKAYGAALILYSLGNDQYINILTKYLSRSNIEAINNKYVDQDLFTSFLSDQNPWIRINAANSLLALDKNNKKALETVNDILETDNIKMLSKAINIIGEYGNTENIPSLEKHLNDDSVRVRVSASEALIRILNRNENTKPGAKDA